MPKKEYLVKLTDEERTTLLALTKKGTIAARKLARAHILRLADEGKPDADIVAAVGVGLSTVERTRKKYVEGGLEVALNERPRPGVKPKLDEKQEAYLIALACSALPENQVKWTMQLLADRMCLDKGYDYEEVRDILHEFSFTAHIRPRGEEAKAIKRQAGFKARRWVVERAHSWMNRFRRLLIRWDKKPENYLAFLHFACGLIAFRAAGLFG